MGNHRQRMLASACVVQIRQQYAFEFLPLLDDFLDLGRQLGNGHPASFHLCKSDLKFTPGVPRSLQDRIAAHLAFSAGRRGAGVHARQVRPSGPPRVIRRLVSAPTRKQWVGRRQFAPCPLGVLDRESQFLRTSRHSFQGDMLRKKRRGRNPLLHA